LMHHIYIYIYIAGYRISSSVARPNPSDRPDHPAATARLDGLRLALNTPAAWFINLAINHRFLFSPFVTSSTFRRTRFVHTSLSRCSRSRSDGGPGGGAAHVAHRSRLRRQRCPPQSDGSYRWRSGLTRIHGGPSGGASYPAPTAPLGGGLPTRYPGPGSAMAAYACAIEQGDGDHPHPDRQPKDSQGKQLPKSPSPIHLISRFLWNRS
jgi:hypothetical protein